MRRKGSYSLQTSLLDIADLLGFSSQSHFQNVFKTITGDTPMAYRKRVK